MTREKVQELATKLDAVADWISDTGGVATSTSQLLKNASRELLHASRYMCNEGFYGCTGDDCDSDSHK